MHASRRHFLVQATAGLGVCVRGLTFPRSVLSSAARESNSDLIHESRGNSCVILDLDRQCALRESTAGFEATLLSLRREFVKVPPQFFRPSPAARVIIVPGCLDVDVPVAEKLAESLQAGGTVLIESGAGFAGPSDFDTHQRLLASRFGVEVTPAVDLWETRKRVPYVDYFWPVRVNIRDFTRVVPLSQECRNVIAWADDRPVAVKQRVGRGTLIFLGSPLGPTLLWGDREAWSWFQQFLNNTQT